MYQVQIKVLSIGGDWVTVSSHDNKEEAEKIRDNAYKSPNVMTRVYIA